MQFDPYQGAPVYMQILHSIRQRIAAGQWPPGMPVPPVRELSLEFGVNPNTAHRSLAELEREGLMYNDPMAGPCITADTGRIAAMRDRMAYDFAAQYHRQMRAVGFGLEDMMEILGRTAQQEEGGRVASGAEDRPDLAHDHGKPVSREL